MKSLRQTVFMMVMGASLVGCAAATSNAPCPETSVVAQAKAPTEAEMNAEHEKLVAAYRTNDVATLDKLLAPDHVHNNVFGMHQDKNTLLEDIKSGVLVFQAYEVTSSQWALYPELAIVTGTIRADATRAGKPVPTHDFRFTRVFTKRNGVWLEWLFHNTMIVAPPTK
ncbi:MAG TPA: nuclear transport factor 2 family protein [Polyangium sp.]|nr:nuclear transport factor 2 family protein [Polyangium sp.]